MDASEFFAANGYENCVIGYDRWHDRIEALGGAKLYDGGGRWALTKDQAAELGIVGRNVEAELLAAREVARGIAAAEGLIESAALLASPALARAVPEAGRAMHVCQCSSTPEARLARFHGLYAAVVRERNWRLANGLSEYPAADAVYSYRTAEGLQHKRQVAFEYGHASAYSAIGFSERFAEQVVADVTEDCRAMVGRGAALADRLDVPLELVTTYTGTSSWGTDGWKREEYTAEPELFQTPAGRVALAVQVCYGQGGVGVLTQIADARGRKLRPTPNYKPRGGRVYLLDRD